MSTPAIEFHDFTVAYGRKPVLWDVDLSIPEGALAAVVGPNGAGKSTLIKAALGLLPSASGYVQIFGKAPSSTLRRVSYVPQRESVDWDFPVTVMDVALMGRYGELGWFRRPKARDRQIAAAALEKVGMAELSKRQIGELSGGQQQRVFLARSLAQDADLYVMDEPFAGVDAATEQSIISVLRGLKSTGKTIICVHHDLQTIPDYFDYVVMLNLRLIAAGPVTEVFTTENLQSTYGGRLTVLDKVREAVRLPDRDRV